MWEHLPQIAEIIVRYGTVIIYIFVAMSNTKMMGSQTDTTNLLQDSETHSTFAHWLLGGSASSLFAGVVTQANIAWFIGIIAGLMSIYNYYLSIKERRLNNKLREQELHVKLKKR